jgi:hypothetical protein
LKAFQQYQMCNSVDHGFGDLNMPNRQTNLPSLIDRCSKEEKKFEICYTILLELQGLMLNFNFIFKSCFY